MKNVYLSLGSNMGNKIQNLKLAISLLGLSPFIRTEKISKFFSSKPYKAEGLNDFVNCIVKIETDFSPQKLLEYTQHIEKVLGRKKTKPTYENRPIDIDIIFFGFEKIKTENLEIPHYDYKNRDFVLYILLDMEPCLINPLTGEEIKCLAQKLENNLEVINE